MSEGADDNLLVLPTGESAAAGGAKSDFHRQWLTALSEGATDSDLVEIAFDHCHAMVFAVANRITGSQWEAEDITQSVFESFARRLHKVQDPAKIPGFLKTAAVRTALRQVKRSRWRRERVAMVHTGEEGRTRSDDAMLAASVRELLERLDPEERAAVVLKFVEMHSHDDVARLMGVSVSTARRRLDKARTKLAKLAGQGAIENLLGQMRAGDKMERVP